ncbi:hypothetical protein NQZ79_g3143 [Umbelopsis isabellina]|nr:hypothetical protein NQZ79_g3143 [Umbelopsis isabellina]
MSMLRTAAIRSVRANARPALKLSRPSTVIRPAPRFYSSHPASHSHPTSTTNWFVGSLIVFGPLLFYLTSPPASKKQHGHADHAPSLVHKIEDAVAVVKAPAKPYVLVGSGTASFAAAQAIKEQEPNASVVIIGNESVPPYMRPPLSKELWFSDEASASETLRFKDWQGNERSAVYQDISEYEIVTDLADINKESTKIKLLLQKTVTKLDVEAHTVELNDGQTIEYNKVLLATGGSPKQLPNQSGVKNVTTFRTVEDLRKLDAIAKKNAHIVVVGGGFLGSELAIALAHRAKKEGLKVTQVFPEEGNMANVFPTYLTKWTTGRVKDEGVEIKSKHSIKSIDGAEGDKVKLTFDNNESLEADHVVVAVGIEPRVEVARAAGLEIDEQRAGVVVNAELESRRDVFAAGDMISFHDIQLGRRRIEHHDHGRHAGENMVGKNKPYKHQSMFWSDLGPKIGYEAVGLVDSQLSTVSVWAKASDADTPAAAVSQPENLRGVDVQDIKSSEEQPAPNSSKQPGNASEGTVFKDEQFGKGLVFYMKNKKVVGVLLFNVFGKVQEARDVISNQTSVEQIEQIVSK